MVQSKLFEDLKDTIKKSKGRKQKPQIKSGSERGTSKVLDLVRNCFHNDPIDSKCNFMMNDRTECIGLCPQWCSFNPNVLRKYKKNKIAEYYDIVDWSLITVDTPHGVQSTLPLK